jgi:hypothetical protein
MSRLDPDQRAAASVRSKLASVHSHAVLHPAGTPGGYAVCVCGATARTGRDGRVCGPWHACSLCVPGAPPPRP